MMLPTLSGYELVFHCPAVDENARCSLRLMRTLRIPDDGKDYPLPPGIGDFELVPVGEHAGRVPAAWRQQGGFMMPMYQAEALWIHFSSRAHPEHGMAWPFALQIAAGGINAISGKTWQPGSRLVQQPQDHVVVPGQPWLDGFSVGKGVIRQFVAMPLGEGFTAEEQLTGAAVQGGLQIRAVPMKRQAYEAMVEEEKARLGAAYRLFGRGTPGPMACASVSLGFAPGGRMMQDIYQSDFGADVWDEDKAVHAFIHVLNSRQWHQVTGGAMPYPPVPASEYTEAGLPWFDYYDETKIAIAGSDTLAGLESVAERKQKVGGSLPDNDPVFPASVVVLKPGQH